VDHRSVSRTTEEGQPIKEDFSTKEHRSFPKTKEEGQAIKDDTFNQGTSFSSKN